MSEAPRAKVEQRHREAAEKYYSATRDQRGGAFGMLGRHGIENAYAQACADTEAQVLAEVAGWLAGKANADGISIVSNTAYAALEWSEALRSGSWRGEATDGE